MGLTRLLIGVVGNTTRNYEVNRVSKYWVAYEAWSKLL